MAASQDSHSCMVSDKERVQSMVANLPTELKGKLALALIKELNENEQGAGDHSIKLPQASGGPSVQVCIGTQSNTNIIHPLSHTEAQTIGSKAHLTGGQLRSAMADF